MNLSDFLIHLIDNFKKLRFSILQKLSKYSPFQSQKKLKPIAMVAKQTKTFHFKIKISPKTSFKFF